MPILKKYENASSWPIIMEKPYDDVSFYPFDNGGIRRIIRRKILGPVGLALLLATGGVLLMCGLMAIGVVK